MALKFNGTDIYAVNFNGTSLTQINYNGTPIWYALQSASIDTTAIVDTPITANTSPAEVADLCSYQWFETSGGTSTDIQGATSRTFTPTTSQFGKTLAVRVSIGSVTVTSNSTNTVVDCIHTGSLFEMTSENTPSPFTVTGRHTGVVITEGGVAWEVFRSDGGNYYAGATGSGDGSSAEIYLGNNYKNIKIYAQTEGGQGTGGVLYVRYSGSSSWTEIAHPYYHRLDGTYTLSSESSIDAVKIEHRYNSGDTWYVCSLRKCLITQWQRI